jgi:hypothetical protein
MLVHAMLMALEMTRVARATAIWDPATIKSSARRKIVLAAAAGYRAGSPRSAPLPAR